MTTPVTEISYPPLDSEATYTFIDSQVDAAAQTGDLQTDFKEALYIQLGLSHPRGSSGYQIDDLWKRYVINTVQGDSNTADGNPATGAGEGNPQGHQGNHLGHYYPPGWSQNPGNANQFPAAEPVPSENVILLTDFDGVTGQLDIHDQATSGHDFNFENGAALSSTQSKYGTTSLLLDGTNDTVSITAKSDLNMGANSFSIEADIYLTDVAGDAHAILARGRVSGGTNDHGYVFRVKADGSLEFEYSTTGTNIILVTSTSSGLITDNSWFHVACCRDDDDDFRLFVNGAVVSSVVDFSAVTINASSEEGRIGSYYGNDPVDDPLQGHIANLRFITGFATYTGAFTPPSAKHEASVSAPTDSSFSSVEVLLPLREADGATSTTDASSNAGTVVFTGGIGFDDTNVKYGDGGALYFDGTDDEIEISTPSWFLGNKDMTFECEVYWGTDPSGTNQTFASVWDSGSNGSWLFGYSSTSLRFGYSITGADYFQETAGWNPIAGQWYTVACEIENNAVSFFVDGTKIGTTQSLASTQIVYDSGAPFTIGSYIDTQYLTNAWVQEVRYTLGVARYGGASYTRPLAPYPTS